jgi:serine/threonine protein kinase
MSVSGASVLGDRYELNEVIGRGGMADVYRATDRVLVRRVAVKLLRDVTGDASERSRFTAEARTLARLSHPALVTVLDAGVDVEQPFLVLELIDGLSLADSLTGPMPAERVAAIGAQVAGALAHAHAAGIVHRDVKPGNVLLGRDGRARLTDFGIARLLGDAARHTKAGFTVGTAAYLAPEQVRGEQVTPAADVYSLGLVLLEALTGERVYQGSPTEAALARLHAPPPVPAQLPPPWREALEMMTTLDPANRPTADDVASRLARWDASDARADAPADAAGDTRVLTSPGLAEPGADATTLVLPRHRPRPRRSRLAWVSRAGFAGPPPVAVKARAAAARAVSRPPNGVVLFAVVVAAVLLAAWLFALANGSAPESEDPQVPQEVPSRLEEPLTDLHDAVYQEAQ